MSLRDRIAAALKATHDGVGDGVTWLGMADAVIAELGLRQETGNDLTYPAVIPITHSRWVTDWKADQ